MLAIKHVPQDEMKVQCQQNKLAQVFVKIGNICKKLFTDSRRPPCVVKLTSFFCKSPTEFTICKLLYFLCQSVKCLACSPIR